MRTLSKYVATALVGLSLIACGANHESLDSVKKAASEKFKQSTVTSVRTTPVKGIYEIVLAPKQVIYVDAKADWAFIGDMVDVTKKVSLTEARMQELNRTDFSKLPLDKAIVLKRGNGARKVAVFSDPDCPFCKKIEKESIAKLDNVTVYTFLYPLQELHPDAARKSSLIWCAQDKQAAWQGFMFEGKLPANDGSCATPLNDIAALGRSLDISGTPAIIFESGEIVSGAIGLADFEARLNAKKK